MDEQSPNDGGASRDHDIDADTDSENSGDETQLLSPPQTSTPDVNSTRATTTTSQNLWQQPVLVPRNKKRKVIYPMAPFELGPWSRAQWHQRFVYVKTELEGLVYNHVRPDDRPVYEARMVGTCPGDARPSIVVVCNEKHFKRIQGLFRKRAEGQLHLIRDQQSLPSSAIERVRSSLRVRTRESTTESTLIPKLQLIYFQTPESPLYRKALNEPLVASLSDSHKTCGGIVQFGGASATLGVALDLGFGDSQCVFMTVDHIFPRPTSESLLTRDKSDIPENFRESNIDPCGYDDHDIPDTEWEDDDEYEDGLEVNDAMSFGDTPIIDANSRMQEQTTDTSKSTLDVPLRSQFAKDELWERVVPPKALSTRTPYLDWALARPQTAQHESVHATNTVILQGHNRDRTVVLESFERSPSRHLAPVYIVSGIRGIVYGQIITAPSFLPSFIPEQESSEAWTVILSIVAGECGSVVVDRETDRVYGHVVGSNMLGYAYVVSLAQVFDQINFCFGDTAGQVRLATPQIADKTSPRWEDGCPDERMAESDTSSSNKAGHLRQGNVSAPTCFESDNSSVDHQDDLTSSTVLTSPASPTSEATHCLPSSLPHLTSDTDDHQVTRAMNKSLTVDISSLNGETINDMIGESRYSKNSLISSTQLTSKLSQLCQTSYQSDRPRNYRTFGTHSAASNNELGDLLSEGSSDVGKYQQDSRALFRTSFIDGLNAADYPKGTSRRPALTVISDAGTQQFKRQKYENTSFSSTIWVPDATLEDRLFAARYLTRHPQVEPWKKDMGFIPKKQLNDIINETSVYQELCQHFARSFDDDKLKEIAAYICHDNKFIQNDGRVKLKSFKPVFALLVMFNKTSEILDIIGEDVTDVDLPLVNIVDGNYGRHRIGRRSRVQKAHKPDDSDIHLWCFTNWSRMESESFLRYQWMMLAPFFQESDYNDVQHYELHDKHILPWVDRDGDTYFEQQGGFATVFPVRIHPEHHNFGDAEACKHGFAIKQLMDKDSVKFNREVEILQKFIGSNAHEHIVSLLATYEHCGKYHMIFYRAQADLFKYWKKVNPAPKFNRDMVLWVSRQFMGISDGLNQLHRHWTPPKLDVSKHSMLGKRKRVVDDIGLEKELNQLGDQLQFGRHGDLKPENILWFEGPKGGQGTLKIADFGQAELHEWQIKTRKRSEVADTMAYRAPECHFGDGKFRQSSDVWSLGCLFLVFVAWALGGADLVNEFAQVRSAFDEYWGVSSDTFFEISRLAEDDTWSVSVKHSVVQMLVIEMESQSMRLPCHHVYRRLNKMQDRCHKDEDYGTTPVPWSLQDITMPMPSSPTHVRPLMTTKGDMEVLANKNATVGLTGLRENKRLRVIRGHRRTKTN
ncbi:hypothetical protein PG995_006014 [Apiospora arundinis]